MAGFAEQVLKMQADPKEQTSEHNFQQRGRGPTRVPSFRHALIRDTGHETTFTTANSPHGPKPPWRAGEEPSQLGSCSCWPSVGLSWLCHPVPATVRSTAKHSKRNTELTARGRENRSRFQKEDSSGGTPPPSMENPRQDQDYGSLHLLQPRAPTDQAHGRVGPGALAPIRTNSLPGYLTAALRCVRTHQRTQISLPNTARRRHIASDHHGTSPKKF